MVKHTYLARVGRRSSSSLLWGDHIAATSGPYWDHVGATLGPHWGHIGATLGQHWGNIGATLWPYYGHVGATLGPHWGHIRATLGATLGQPAFLFLCLKGAPEAFRHVAQVRSKYSLISVARMWSNVVQRGPNVSPMWPNAGGRNVAPNQSG